MERKNKELVKKNLELLEEVNNLNTLHTDILKEDIKRKYNGTRSFTKLLQTIDDNIDITQKLLDSSIKVKEDLSFLNSLFNEDKDSLKKKNEIINVLGENKNMIEAFIKPNDHKNHSDRNTAKNENAALNSNNGKKDLENSTEPTSLKNNKRSGAQDKVLKEINKNIIKEPKKRKTVVKKFKK